jgi:putative membrane protein
LHTLPKAGRERVRQALDEARKSTSAKLEVIVVPASDHYALYSMIWGAVTALVATGALALLKPGLHIGAGFIVNAILFALLSVIFDWWPIRIAIVPHAAKRAAATRLAHREFAASAMSRDNEQNGVMLFVSLAERHLEVIAERGAHAKVQQASWDKIVADATAAMRAKGVVEGLAGAVDACGKALAAAFPGK